LKQDLTNREKKENAKLCEYVCLCVCVCVCVILE